MRYLSLFFILLITSGISQQASEYFPASDGYKWYTKTVVLDSLNQEIDSLAAYTIDSLAGETTYKGYQAKYILGKTGLYETVTYQPYIDTSFVSLSGSDARTYFGLGNINSLLGLIDTTAIDSTLLGVLGLLSSVEGWYPTYKFTSSVGTNYTLFTKDTTIVVQDVTLPLRFQAQAKRVNDGPLTTEIGTFNCKKFVLSYSVKYILPPFISITLITIPDTHYVAQGNWIVKTIAPSTTLDLSFVQLGTFTFPGRMEVVIPPIIPTSVEDFEPAQIDGFALHQNYPNPFNPETTISFNLPDNGFVSLKVYDNLGNLIATPISRDMQAGTHKMSFSGNDLASGVYFYRLETERFSETRRMILLK